MEKAGWAGKKFLIDGFPWNEDNCKGWDDVIGEEADVKGVIYFEVQEETLLGRVLERWASSKEEDVWNDDTEEVAWKWFFTYVT